MRKLIILILMTGLIIGAGCSTASEVTTPTSREAQYLESGTTPALAFQLNAYFALGDKNFGYFTPIDIPLGVMGLSKEEALKIMSGASLVNATCPIDVEIPEWDEWLLGTVKDVEVPEWDEWLLDVEVPEWDEWLLRFAGMEKYRSTDWLDWAVYGPLPILDVEVPEWDEWLLHLTLGHMALSYDAWWLMDIEKANHK